MLHNICNTAGEHSVWKLWLIVCYWKSLFVRFLLKRWPQLETNSRGRILLERTTCSLDLEEHFNRLQPCVYLCFYSHSVLQAGFTNFPLRTEVLQIKCTCTHDLEHCVEICQRMKASELLWLLSCKHVAPVQTVMLPQMNCAFMWNGLSQLKGTCLWILSLSKGEA